MFPDLGGNAKANLLSRVGLLEGVHRATGRSLLHATPATSASTIGTRATGCVGPRRYLTSATTWLPDAAELTSCWTKAAVSGACTHCEMQEYEANLRAKV